MDDTSTPTENPAFAPALEHTETAHAARRNIIYLELIKNNPAVLNKVAESLHVQAAGVNRNERVLALLTEKAVSKPLQFRDSFNAIEEARAINTRANRIVSSTNAKDLLKEVGLTGSIIDTPDMEKHIVEVAALQEVALYKEGDSLKARLTSVARQLNDAATSAKEINTTEARAKAAHMILSGDLPVAKDLSKAPVKDLRAADFVSNTSYLTEAAPRPSDHFKLMLILKHMQMQDAEAYGVYTKAILEKEGVIADLNNLKKITNTFRLSDTEQHLKLIQEVAPQVWNGFHETSQMAAVGVSEMVEGHGLSLKHLPQELAEDIVHSKMAAVAFNSPTPDEVNEAILDTIKKANRLIKDGKPLKSQPLGLELLTGQPVAESLQKVPSQNDNHYDSITSAHDESIQETLTGAGASAEIVSKARAAATPKGSKFNVWKSLLAVTVMTGIVALTGVGIETFDGLDNFADLGDAFSNFGVMDGADTIYGSDNIFGIHDTFSQAALDGSETAPGLSGDVLAENAEPPAINTDAPAPDPSTTSAGTTPPASGTTAPGAAVPNPSTALPVDGASNLKNIIQALADANPDAIDQIQPVSDLLKELNLGDQTSLSGLDSDALAAEGRKLTEALAMVSKIDFATLDTSGVDFASIDQHMASLNTDYEDLFQSPFGDIDSGLAAEANDVDGLNSGVTAEAAECAAPNAGVDDLQSTALRNEVVVKHDDLNNIVRDRLRELGIDVDGKDMDDRIHRMALDIAEHNGITKADFIVPGMEIDMTPLGGMQEVADLSPSDIPEVEPVTAKHSSNFAVDADKDDMFVVPDQPDASASVAATDGPKSDQTTTGKHSSAFSVDADKDDMFVVPDQPEVVEAVPSYVAGEDTAAPIVENVATANAAASVAGRTVSQGANKFIFEEGDRLFDVTEKFMQEQGIDTSSPEAQKQVAQEVQNIIKDNNLGDPFVEPGTKVDFTSFGDRLEQMKGKMPSVDDLNNAGGDGLKANGSPTLRQQIASMASGFSRTIKNTFVQ